MTTTATLANWHFCNQACYASHATDRDRAADAAELCQDARHWELYPDNIAARIEAHIDAHRLGA